MCTNSALRPTSRWRMVASWIPGTSGCRSTVVLTSVMVTSCMRSDAGTQRVHLVQEALGAGGERAELGVFGLTIGEGRRGEDSDDLVGDGVAAVRQRRELGLQVFEARVAGRTAASGGGRHLQAVQTELTNGGVELLVRVCKTSERRAILT